MSQTKHIPRIFIDDDLGENRTITLPDDKRHHLTTVLRLSAGDPLLLFNGDGFEYESHLVQVDRKQAQATIQRKTAPRREPPVQITLVQSVVRGDRMDFALAKAVELGVSAIRPVFSARGQIRLQGTRLDKKQTHWHRVVESAAEQSGRLVRPALRPAVDLATLLDAPPPASRLLALLPGATKHLGCFTKARSVALLIGPESGFSEPEIKHIATAGWQAAALGPRILRTETAGMAAIASLQTLWGDLNGQPG